ncbi:Linear gramicidin synthase subunit A [Taenia crassiceps]|uniref:Linear gramicidin synthase subunit A n=1 Tax=Taenia crassiceps TaxID=6207 RepID=A0ABR4QEQ6_9CEST
MWQDWSARLSNAYGRLAPHHSAMQETVKDTKTSVITGHLSDEFSNSNGILTNLQLGDRIFNMKVDDDSTTAVISFQAVENEVGIVERLSVADLRVTVVKLASILRERLTPLLQQRKVDLTSEIEQSRTFLATHITTGINRVLLQLACMLLRLVYIPMDSNLSKQRMASIAESFSPIAFITDDDDFKPELGHVPLFALPQLLNQAEASCCRNVEPLFKDMTNPVILLLFTSGSTSPIPKAILLRNSQLASRLCWQWSSTSPLAELTGPRLAKTSWLFIDAFTEMFGPLLGGQTVVVFGKSTVTSERLVSDADFLGRLVSRFQIVQITSVPSQLEAWMKQLDRGAEAFRSLRAIVSSGQILTFTLATRVFEVFEHRPLRLLNLYGSTEVAGDVTALAFDSKEEIQSAAAKSPAGGLVLPVGKPIPNVQIYVVNKICKDGSANVADRGEEGEVLVSGAAILLEEPVMSDRSPRQTVSLTANPLSTQPCFSRIFRTGDMGFICPTSSYLYITGRVDDIVKVNGVKICVGNIDQLLARLRCEGGVFTGLGTTLTIPFEKGETSTRLICFYQREAIGANAFTNADLAQVVRTSFSAFLNVTFVEVPSFPLQRHTGKIDRVRLRQDFQNGLYNQVTHPVDNSVKVVRSTPDSQREAIRRVFARHLGLSEAAGANGEPSDEKDFFLIGGDSITVANVVSELRKQGFRVSLNDFAVQKKIGEILDVLMSQRHLDHEEPPFFLKKRPFVREYQPGKTFSDRPFHDVYCREVIAEVIAESFVQHEPLAQMINLSAKTMRQIVFAGFTHGDPDGPLEALLPDVCAAIIGFPVSSPPAPEVEDPLYYHVEEAFEVCDTEAGEVEDASKCFSSGLLGVRHDNVNGGERIQILALLEEAFIDGVRKSGYTAIRSINTSVVTQVMAEELGYVHNCTVNLASVLEARGVKCDRNSLLVKVATLKIGAQK